MGEYAKFKGQEIKIGTCEDMFYLRADQRYLVDALPGNVNPADPSILEHIRFRFPWPDEDGLEPGADSFHAKGFGRAFVVSGILPPANVKHYSIQFSAAVGLLVSLPCPNSAQAHGAPYTVHRNGYSGDVQIIQQRYWDGALWTVCKCGACGAPYRLPPEDGEELAVRVRSQADKDTSLGERARSWHQQVADRILAGYGDHVSL